MNTYRNNLRFIQTVLFSPNKLHVTLKTSIVFPNSIVASSILKTGTQFKWLSSSFDLTCLVFYRIKKRKLFLSPWRQNIGTTEDARSIKGRDFRCVTITADWHNAPPIGPVGGVHREWISPKNFGEKWEFDWTVFGVHYILRHQRRQCVYSVCITKAVQAVDYTAQDRLIAASPNAKPVLATGQSASQTRPTVCSADTYFHLELAPEAPIFHFAAAHTYPNLGWVPTSHYTNISVLMRKGDNNYLDAAQWIANLPWLSIPCTSANLSVRTLIQLRWPLEAAMCKALSPRCGLK